jgi:hypothetical protein
VLIKINKKNIAAAISQSQTEIQGLLHPGEANLGYFLAWFQSLQLPSTQSQTPLALSHFASKPNLIFQNMYSTVNRIFHC